MVSFQFIGKRKRRFSLRYIANMSKGSNISDDMDVGLLSETKCKRAI